MTKQTHAALVERWKRACLDAGREDADPGSLVLLVASGNALANALAATEAALHIYWRQQQALPAPPSPEGAAPPRVPNAVEVQPGIYVSTKSTSVFHEQAAPPPAPREAVRVLEEVRDEIQERIVRVSLALADLDGLEKRDEYSRQHGRKAAYAKMLDAVDAKLAALRAEGEGGRR